MPWCSDAGPLKAHHGQIANIFNQLDRSEMEKLMASRRRMVESELSAEQGNITSQNIAEARCIIARIAIDLSERGIITLDATPET
ncbi:hypothetical protein [Brucella abortus]|uniref:hypothetical protein n=1 Tax=Brucella abortus TaxID=235 RepID=UPI002E337195|nr:hypothetical protein [Brucella abortus]